MPNESLRDYFRFTRKERIGVIGLSILVMIIAWLPRFINPKPIANPALIQAGIQQLKQREDSMVSKEQESNLPDYKENKNFLTPATTILFYFDPNTLGEEGWLKLGVKEKTIGTIKKYLSKGGSFKSASDIHKIYGINKELASKLEPFIKINKDRSTDNFAKPNYPNKGYSQNPPKTVSSLDINRSDTTEWIALPGIGSTLARRIVLFREKLGGFHSVEQVRETYGLADSVFNMIKTKLELGDSTVKKININTADANRLKQHPYIGWKLANALIKYRDTHGLFEDPKQLSKIDLFTADLLLKLMPYLSVEEE